MKKCYAARSQGYNGVVVYCNGVLSHTLVQLPTRSFVKPLTLISVLEFVGYLMLERCAVKSAVTSNAQSIEALDKMNMEYVWMTASVALKVYSITCIIQYIRQRKRRVQYTPEQCFAMT